MRITLVHEDNAYGCGEILPKECMVSKNAHGPAVLLEAEQNPKGEDIVLTGVRYYINKKEYDLSSGYGIEAVIRDDQVIPKLRRAKGEERYALTHMVKKGPRQKPERIGVMLEWWPAVTKLWSEPTQNTEFIDEALNIIEEAGEITEDFALPQDNLEALESMEYYEEEQIDPEGH